MSMQLSRSQPSQVVSVTQPNLTPLGYAWTITGAAWVSLGATCSVAGGSVTFRLVCTDIDGAPTTCSPPLSWTSSPGPADFGALWLGTPSEWPVYSVCADLLYLKIDAIVGAWTFNLQAFVPPAVP
jgi:hypothetical protein